MPPLHKVYDKLTKPIVGETLSATEILLLGSLIYAPQSLVVIQFRQLTTNLSVLLTVHLSLSPSAYDGPN